MVNYKLGKIYKIVSDKTEMVYIGSTCEILLCRRMAVHKNDYKLFTNGTRPGRCGSFEILKFDDAKMVLLESYPCVNKDELHSRERYWIEKTKDTVNKYAAIITAEEKKAKNKEYYSRKVTCEHCSKSMTKSGMYFHVKICKALKEIKP